MAQLINEVKRMQLLAGLINESQLNELTVTPGEFYITKSHGVVSYVGIVPAGGSHKGQKNPTGEDLLIFADKTGKKGIGLTKTLAKKEIVDIAPNPNKTPPKIISIDSLEGGLLDMIKQQTGMSEDQNIESTVNESLRKFRKQK
jgi:hypothetical protein